MAGRPGLPGSSECDEDIKRFYDDRNADTDHNRHYSAPTHFASDNVAPADLDSR
jgi:hypothetical protein